MLGPEQTTEQNQPLYRWQSVAGAGSYELKIPGNDGEQLISISADDAGCPQSTAPEAECSLTSEAILSSGKHKWRLRATTSASAGKWSKYSRFTIAAAPSPEPDQPINLTTYAGDNTVSLGWDKATHADSYIICQSPAPITDAENCANGTLLNSANEHLQADGLNNNTTYYFTVLAVNSSGSTPVYSSPSAMISAKPHAVFTDIFPSGLAANAIPFSQWQDATPTFMNTPGFQSYQMDADTNHKVWRFGGNNAEMGGEVNYPDGNGALGVLHGQHFYSKVSPTNSDETYVIGSGGQNQRFAALWHLASHKLVAWLPASEPESHVEQRQLTWDNTAPNVYWYTQGNELVRATIDFSDYSVTKEIWDTFPLYEHITLGYGEGNFSDDGQRTVITGKAADSDYLYFTPYDVNQRTKHSRRQVTSPTQPEFDWAGVDPTGQYILFNRITPNKQTVVVPFANAATAEPTILYEHQKHSDFVVDREGEIWIVYGNWQGLHASRLSDGFDKRVWPAGEDVLHDEYVTASGHVARVKGVPGLVLVSRHYDGGLYYINIDQPGYSVYLGNSRHGRSPVGSDANGQSDYQGVDENGEVTFYKREPRGAVSASGRHIFFAADYQAYLTSGEGYIPEPEWCKAYLNVIEPAL